MDEKLISYLNQHNVKYKEHKHKAVFTVKESTGIKSLPGLPTKNLFLKDEKNNFYLICMDANKRLNIKFLKAKLEVNNLKFASSDELMEKLNIQPGSVSLFNMVHAKDVELIIDESVWGADITGFHPNENTSTFEINHQALELFYKSLKSKKRILKIE
jgi:Ala-tRNA(Pro) deacylase